MIKNPEISVVLPYYNAESTLQKAIESILNQSFNNFELLLVDNNSTDTSAAIASELAQSDSRIILLNEEKQGVSNAMNCGLKNASGKFLARMDADDIAHNQRLKKQHQFLTTNTKIDFVGTEVKYVTQNKNTSGFQRFVQWVNSFHTSEEIELNRFVEIPIVNPTILFRRALFEKYGGCLDGDFPEDYEMQLRYLEKGVKMAKLPEHLLEWHDHSTRLTRTDERYSTEAFFKIKAHYFFKWSEQNNRFHPNIWVWGAGRKTRQRAKLLETEGLIINGFIDIVKAKTTRKTTIHFTEVPDPGEMFIVPMVTKTGAREQIKAFLLKADYIEGDDFMLMG